MVSSDAIPVIIGIFAALSLPIFAAVHLMVRNALRRVNPALGELEIIRRTYVRREFLFWLAVSIVLVSVLLVWKFYGMVAEITGDASLAATASVVVLVFSTYMCAVVAMYSSRGKPTEFSKMEDAYWKEFNSAKK